jgi:hypothetical protein
VHELVIVVADLYLPRELHGARGEPAGFVHLPGIESVARFGERARLADGWRTWLLARVGRADLGGVAPAYIAAASLDAPPASPAITLWIATAVHLRAGLAGVHLDQYGLLRLAADEQDALAQDFARSFASSGYTLAPLPRGELLLSTPGLQPVTTEEPARYAGRELHELPTARAAAPVRRLLAEIEMWLHAQPLNDARRLRGAAPVTGLWPWGAAGRIVRPEVHPQSAPAMAFGQDSWLEGLWRLQGAACQAPPQRLEEVLAMGERDAVLVLEAGGQLRGEEQTLADGLRRLDERFIFPALQALRRRDLGHLTVILNDASARVHRGSLRRFWCRAQPGLAGFA